MKTLDNFAQRWIKMLKNAQKENNMLFMNKTLKNTQIKRSR